MTTNSRKFQSHDVVLVNDEEYKNRVGIIYNIDYSDGHEPVFTVVFFVRDGLAVTTKFVSFSIYSLSPYDEPVALIRELKIGDTFYLKERFNCFYTGDELRLQGTAVTLQGISPHDENPNIMFYRDTSLHEWKLINIDIPRTNRGLVNKDVQTKLAPTLPKL